MQNSGTMYVLIDAIKWYIPVTVPSNRLYFLYIYKLGKLTITTEILAYTISDLSESK